MEDIGISILLPASEGPWTHYELTGQLKMEPQDFLVSEISMDGLDACHCFNNPSLKGASTTESKSEQAGPPGAAAPSKQDSQDAPPSTSPQEAPDFHALVNEADLASLTALHESVLKYLQEENLDGVPIPEPHTLKAPESREGRKVVHNGIVERFPFLMTGGEGDQIVCKPDLKAPLAFRPLLTFEDLQRLQQYLSRGPPHADAIKGVELGPFEDKEKRTAFHRAVSSHHRLLNTRTVNGGAQGQRINVAWVVKKGSKRRREEEGGGKRVYSRVVVRKENMEHLDALSRLAAALKLSFGSLGFAGTKDKKAVTYQWVSIADRSPAQLCSGDTRSIAAGVAIGSAASCASPLTLGHMQGNRFKIRVRGVQACPAAGADPPPPPAQAASLVDFVSRTSEGLRRRGFVNYFGSQRLGNPLATGQMKTYELGRALLRRDFGEALRILLEPREADMPSVRAAKVAYWEGDVAAALRLMPNRMTREKAVLRGLHRYGKDKAWQALRCINYTTRKQWLGAYQAWVWNRAASERVRVYGLRPVPGDLIFEDGPQHDNKPRAERLRVLTAEEIEQAGVAENHEEGAHAPSDGPEPLPSLLYSIVLPLPGHGVAYPDHQLKQFYEGLLAADGLSHVGSKGDDRDTAELDMKGAYRAILVRPRDLTAVVEPSAGVREGAKEAAVGSEGAMDVVAEFVLPSGSFATVMLRELMHGDRFMEAAREGREEEEVEGEEGEEEEDGGKTEELEEEGGGKKAREE